MDPLTAPPNLATCTTCTFADDFSNYWTAVLYFRARNGSYHRVPQKPNVGFEQAKGGMTVYYTPFLTRSTGTSTTSPGGSSAVTAFKPGFRMLIGQQSARTRAEASRFRQLTYTCLQNSMTRTGETLDMPTRPCPAGIMSNVRFPTCWDGANLDSPDHASHVAYPASGTFESGGPCPATHPVRIPQLFYEVVWDTTAFNAKELWPADGGQPFVWSQGDRTGFGNHGDYVFGWKGDALQVAMDSNCDRCPQLKSQGLDKGNQCARQAAVREEVDGCKSCCFWLGTYLVSRDCADSDRA